MDKIRRRLQSDSFRQKQRGDQGWSDMIDGQQHTGPGMMRYRTDHIDPQ